MFSYFCEILLVIDFFIASYALMKDKVKLFEISVIAIPILFFAILILISNNL